VSVRRLHPAPGSVLLVLIYPLASAASSALILAVVGIDSYREPGFLEAWMPVLVAAPWLLALPLLLGPGRWMSGLDRAALGLARPLRWREGLQGVVLGTLLLVVPASLAVASGGYIRIDDAGASIAALTGVSVLSKLPALAVAIGFAAFGEELLCRGLLLRYWEPLTGTYGAIAISSLVFTAMHGANPGVSVLGLLGVLLWGVLLGVVFARSSSMLLATGLHASWNFATTSILGLPVSGMELASLSRWEVAKDRLAQLMFGGDFGPEEGLAFHLVLILAIVVTWRMWGPDLGQTE
jgi:membrane protease YdiL (CAAX protease family)